MKLGHILPDSYDENVLFTSFYSKMSNIVDKYVALRKAAEERNQIYVRLNYGLPLSSRYLWT